MPLSPTELEAPPIVRRKLILHDSLAILSLALVTVALFVVTLLLFSSFRRHRADLAQSWSEQGRAELEANQPDQAVTSLRTALAYAPGKRAYEQLLAEALGRTGRPEESEESYQYFMSLWDTEPGNGPINLALARLTVKRHDRQAAINFYRAAIYGTWEGDGVARRAQVRLELARYLIAEGELIPARTELLIAGGNAPDDYDRDMALGEMLEQTNDTTDAASYYQKAAAARPGEPAAYEANGRLAYSAGDFAAAYRMLDRARAVREKGHLPDADAADATLLQNAGRILELTPAADLSAHERVDHILAARAIAKQRFDGCVAGFAAAPAQSSPLYALRARWAGPEGTASATALLRDPDLDGSAMQLVFDTETDAEKLCGGATGDDVLLLEAARNHPVAQTVVDSQTVAGDEKAHP